MTLLRIKDLVISFGGIRALAGIDLQVEEGELLAVIGPNGSGKTTLFNCISGVYKPDQGEIFLNGGSLLGLSPDSIAHRGIARTFQNLRLFLHTTVLDNLLLGRHIKFRRNLIYALLRMRKEELRHRETVEEIIDFLDLQAYRKARVVDCPYGIQKKVELGRALALEPQLLLLDEPVSGLTVEEKEESAYRIGEIRGRFHATILLVEHDLRIASRLADRMVALNYGQKIAEGSPEQVQKNSEVIRAYLGEG
ncbi:MAG: ABC transporter ATP-binding protein [Deltaproteobacteria bacterium]|nr:ABC transporter ATP-binding protein [Deltaproteobacteria bacterium]